jgi:hypothetical protein
MKKLELNKEAAYGGIWKDNQLRRVFHAAHADSLLKVAQTP